MAYICLDLASSVFSPDQVGHLLSLLADEIVAKKNYEYFAQHEAYGEVRGHVERLAQTLRASAKQSEQEVAKGRLLRLEMADAERSLRLLEAQVNNEVKKVNNNVHISWMIFFTYNERLINNH